MRAGMNTVLIIWQTSEEKEKKQNEEDKKGGSLKRHLREKQAGKAGLVSMNSGFTAAFDVGVVVLKSQTC